MATDIVHKSKKKKEVDQHQTISERKGEYITALSLAARQSNLTVSPGFASATSDAGPEPGPHVSAGLLVPLLGF